MNRFFDRWRGDLVAFLSGGLLTLSFAPFNIIPFVFIALVGFQLSIHYTKKWRAFFRGWLFGLGFFGTGTSWIYASMANYTGAPLLVSMLLTLLFVMLFAGYPAFNGFLYQRYLSQNHWTKPMFFFPLLWVMLEWVRSIFYTGFPWLLLGDTQIITPLKGYAPFFGVFGVSFAVALTASAIVTGFILVPRLKRPCVSILLGLWFVGGALTLIQWTRPIEKPIKATLLQGDIPQMIKWTPEAFQKTIDTYVALTKEYPASDLIIWPEASIPARDTQVKPLIDQLQNYALAHQQTLLIGIPIYSQPMNKTYNGILAVGKNQGQYLKTHLVPFGEYFPLNQKIKSFLENLNIPLSDLSSGSLYQKNIPYKDGHIASLICYETIFPELTGEAVLKGADFIVAVTDDGWFAHTLAQSQHLAMTRMRAIETQRYILFDTNDGITAIIGPDGSIIQKARPYTTTAITGEIQRLSGKTFWVAYGFAPALLFILFGFIVLSIINKRVKKKK